MPIPDVDTSVQLFKKAPGHFPLEVGIQIFSYLTVSDLHVVAFSSLVNKTWYKFTNEESLWQVIIAQRFCGKALYESSLKNVVRNIEARKLKSNEEIVSRIEAFVYNMSIGKNGRFRCHIGKGSKYQTISLEIKGRKNGIDLPQNAPLAYENSITITEFDSREDYTAVDCIQDGSFVGFNPRESEPKDDLYPGTIHEHFFVKNEAISILGEHIITCRAPPNFAGDFKAVLRFPDIPGTEKPALRVRIQNILRQTVDELIDTSLHQEQNRMMVAFSIVSVIAGFVSYIFRDPLSEFLRPGRH